MSIFGVRGEERDDLSAEENRRIRHRSVALLKSLLRPLARLLLATAGTIVLSTIARVVGPSLIGVGVDVGLPALLAGDPWVVVGAAVGLIASGVVGAVLLSRYTRMTARISQAVLIDLRKRMFRHAQRLSMEFHESYTSGRIIARQTSDLDAISGLLNAGLSQLVGGVLLMIFTAAAIFFNDPVSGLVLVVAFVPLAIVTRWYHTQSRKQFRLSRVTSARMIVQFVETMTGIRAVKGFRRERANDENFGHLIDQYRRVSLRGATMYQIYEPAILLLGNLTAAAVLLVGSFRVAGGELDVGALLAVVLYARQFFGPTQQVAGVYNSYQSASAALEKISGVLEERESIPDPTTPISLTQPRGSLDLEGVSFGYSADRLILPAFELHIPAGQTIALVGSTGAGKSTLAKLIARFYDPTSGSISLDGVDLRRVEQAELRRAVVMVTQESYLFSGSVARNIAVGKPDATRQEIEVAARSVGAHDFIMAMESGYDTEINKRGGRVSAGQRQLLSFARAFLANPTVLILDEATASLDIPSERLVQRGLSSLLADRTAIIIAHRLSTVEIAERVLVMDNGRIVEDGTPLDLISGTGRFAKMHSAWQDSLA